jgi:uncharacterized membrane protein YphA (DoxX/SURF4 family)
MFPAGWPGLGLLLLRLAASLTSVSEGLHFLVTSGLSNAAAWILGVMWLLLGVSFLIGFLTPICGSVGALAGASVVLSLLPVSLLGNLHGKFAAIDFIVITLSLILLGPGAFSVDARLFGRREIIIRDAPRPPRT